MGLLDQHIKKKSLHSCPRMQTSLLGSEADGVAITHGEDLCPLHGEHSL